MKSSHVNYYTIRSKIKYQLNTILYPDTIEANGDYLYSFTGLYIYSSLKIKLHFTQHERN